ncbi:protein NRT1/ PTR FAMILY 5.6-like [Magnolia sinica]|uniref:protein NRT1/ PTR FAMILY 5.6-like n=1 Tax=Magnolia sinica TaxID=86752 RepID=UPI0026580C22|nr:protein NRT1/ PTR FAMILY 5.6-like [Magnolia sinica]
MMQRLRKWTSSWMIKTSEYRHAWGVSTFIIGVVISNSLSEYAVVGSLIDFLVNDTPDLYLSVAAAIINIKMGCTSFMAIIGSFIADAYFSRYFVVLVSLALNIYGLLLFTLSIPHHGIYIYLFYLAMLLIAMGEGGQEYTLTHFGADQFKKHIKDKRKAKRHSTALFYIGSFVGSVLGMILTFTWSRLDIPEGSTKILKNVWGISGLCSAMVMLLAFLVLVLGTSYYRRDVPRGSPFTRMLRVVVAAARKRHLDWPADDNLIHGGRNPGGVASGTSDGHEDYNINVTIEKLDVDGNTSMTHRRIDNHSNGEGDMQLKRSNSKENPCFEDVEIKRDLVDDENLRPCIDRKGHTRDDDACLSPALDGYPASNYENDEQLRRCLDRCGHTGDDDSRLSVFHESSSVNQEDDGHPTHETHWLPHTSNLRWLDKASIIEKPGAEQESKWRLCTQTEVEETKLFLRLFPVWASFLAYGIVLSIGRTFFLFQASYLNAKLGDFEVPVMFLVFVYVLSRPVVTIVFIPLLNSLIRLKHEISPELRIGAGLTLSVLCCFTALFVEKKMMKAAVREDPNDPMLSMSIFWLIPQFWLLGAVNELVGHGIKELFNSHVPKTIGKCEDAFSESVEGMGSFLSAIAMVSLRPWDCSLKNFNECKLDSIYLSFGVISFINLLFYVFIAKVYLWQGTGNGHEKETGRREATKLANAITEFLEEILKMCNC